MLRINLHPYVEEMNSDLHGNKIVQVLPNLSFILFSGRLSLQTQYKIEFLVTGVWFSYEHCYKLTFSLL